MATREEEKSERLERAITDLGLQAADREKALELAKFFVRIGTIDMSKLPAGLTRAGDTVCNSGC